MNLEPRGLLGRDRGESVAASQWCLKAKELGWGCSSVLELKPTLSVLKARVQSAAPIEFKLKKR
jgi:hypothetical protein